MKYAGFKALNLTKRHRTFVLPNHPNSVKRGDGSNPFFRFQPCFSSPCRERRDEMRRKKMFFQPNGKFFSWEKSAPWVNESEKQPVKLKKCIWKSSLLLLLWTSDKESTPARTSSLLSSCQRKDWNESKMTKRMIGFWGSIVVVLLVREQPRYKVIQNITQYTNLQLFFSETFISLVLQNSICIPFAKQKQAVSGLFHSDL